MDSFTKTITELHVWKVAVVTASDPARNSNQKVKIKY